MGYGDQQPTAGDSDKDQKLVYTMQMMGLVIFSVINETFQAIFARSNEAHTLQQEQMRDDEQIESYFIAHNEIDNITQLPFGQINNYKIMHKQQISHHYNSLLDEEYFLEISPQMRNALTRILMKGHLNQFKYFLGDP